MMNIPLKNNHSISQPLLSNTSNPTIVSALAAGLLPANNVPTNATPNYSIYNYYAETGQQHAVNFTNNITHLITAYQNYPNNWDGYEGVPASPETVKDTLIFIEKLPFGATQPRPGLSGDGEVSLFWENDDFYIDIGFLGDGKYTFYARDHQQVEYLKDDVDLNASLPNELLNLIYT